jgi:hypothetical protein
VFIFKSVKPRPLTASPPTGLLGFIAGEFAPRVASLWPEPHLAFLTAPAARRHLVCLALSRAAPGAAIDACALLTRPMKQAVKAAIASPPEGLARALERLGERAWKADDYAALLRVLASQRTGKALQHRDEITAPDVRALGQLPDALLDHGLGRLPLSDTAAGLVADAFNALAARDGEAAARTLAPRWAGADTLKTLIEFIALDLEPEPPAPPFAGTDRLRPLATKAAILDAAGRFKNCMRGQMHWACSGSSAFYEWIEPPGVVLEITRDRLRGWVLDQARLVENKPVPQACQEAITETLRSMGVHVGRSLWRLNDALGDATGAPPSPVQSEEEVIQELFGA